MFVNKLFTYLRAHISKSKRCFNVKPSTYYFLMKTKILYRVLTSTKRWRITLFSQSPLISQFSALWDIEILCFGKWKLPSFMFSCHVCMWTCLHVKNCFPSLLYINRCAWSISVLVEDYQVKFCQTESNHQKSILSNIIKKLFCM